MLKLPSSLPLQEGNVKTVVNTSNDEDQRLPPEVESSKATTANRSSRDNIILINVPCQQVGHQLTPAEHVDVTLRTGHAEHAAVADARVPDADGLVGAATQVVVDRFIIVMSHKCCSSM